MTRTELLALMVAVGLSGPGRALAATDGTARAAALEALAAKADLPASRPALPSLLTDPDARMALVDDGAGAGQGGGSGNGNGKAGGKAEAPGQLKKEAAADAAKANAAAANGEAARAAALASADAQDAKEKLHEKKTREKHPKPPHPPKGGGN